MEASVKNIASQPSWVIRSSDVELAITQLGGHMAPVTFFRNSGAPVQPYYISPWQGEGLTVDEPVLAPLRGDFFCMPFGANAQDYRGEKYKVHGEPAGQEWTLVGAEQAGGVTSLTLSMQTRICPGAITKKLHLADGQNVVYSQHVLTGFEGRMPLGHHETLAMPEREGSVLVATSPLRFGMTCPHPVGPPSEAEYYSIRVNRRFKSLSRVPLAWVDERYGDFSALPARRGFTDLLAVFYRPTLAPAWTAATFVDDGFVWFSLKDSAVLPSTVFWVSNRGRHRPPWNGRNCCLGLEDVCAFFADGLVPSVRPNVLSKAGIPTSVKLSPSHPTVINHIQGVVKVARGFGKVKSVVFGPGTATFVSVSGKRATAEVNHEFLRSGVVRS